MSYRSRTQNKAEEDSHVPLKALQCLGSRAMMGLTHPITQGLLSAFQLVKSDNVQRLITTVLSCVGFGSRLEG